MAKRKSRKAKVAILAPIEAPTREAMQHAQYEKDDLIHAESFTRATVYRVRQQSSLRKLHVADQLTDAQYYAAQEIAHVAERLQRGLGARCASLVARVDCSGSGRDEVAEKLGYVRAEATYTRWRTAIPLPRRMIIDMVLEDRALFATARVYRVGWPRAKRLLLNALDLWCDLRKRAYCEINECNVDFMQTSTSA